MNEYVSLILGVVCAGIGGELFVRGTVGLGHWLRISPGIIGATIVAFATSSPELSVSVNAALAGTPQIGLGNALGGNVVNVVLILALALVISGIQTTRDSVKRDFPVALLVPVVTGVLLLDGKLSRIDGFLMLGTFIVWLIAAVIEARKQQSAADDVFGEHRWGLIILSCIFGLAFLVLAGNLIVAGAEKLAISFGVDNFVIGATVVAVGTTVPELATTVIARLRGHDELSLGTILGSNIFNGLFIIAVLVIIQPVAVSWNEVAISLVFGFVALVFTYPNRFGFIERRRGVLLLVLYAAYLTAILQR